MKSVLDVIKEFFLLLFGGNTDDAGQKRKLRLIKDQLMSSVPNYFNPSKNEVLPGFANLIYKLAMALRPIKQIFEKIFKEDDVASAHRWCTYLIEEQLPENLTGERYRFVFTEIKKRINGVSEPKVELSKVKTEFQEVIKNLSQADVTRINRTCNDLNRLATLCRYNYGKMLVQFDPKVDLTVKEYAPKFLPVTGGLAAPEILDFYYVSADFQVTDDLMDNIYLLLDRLVSETKRATYKQKVGEILVWIQRVLNSQLSKEVLSNLVRAIYGDAAYSLKVDHSWHNYMEDYLNRLQRQFDQEWDRLNREQDESMINMDLTILFNKAALLEVEGYSEKVSNALMELELNSFTHTTAIQIMKSFILMKFEKDFKETIKRILVDGFFEDKAFQATLTNIVYECEHSLDTVTQFEQSLETTEPGTENVLQKLIEAYKQGNKVSATLNNLIIKIDKQAGQIVESNANNFNRLGQIILEIINDFKLKTPIKISNIKVLGGEKNSDIIKLLVERTKDIIRFINIMKRFTIIQSGPLVLKKPTP